MSLKVIGAGFGRTGTNSMQIALNSLGFGPCHHMSEVSDNPLMKTRWRAFMKGTDFGWGELFEGYASCMDWPSAYYWRDLMQIFPEARLILTWRDPESWWRSFENTLLKYYEQTDDRDSVGYQIIDKVFDGQPEGQDLALALYEANVEAVRATVPADRLLVHALGDGWEPLCAYLGVPVPDQPYPRTNSTAKIQARFELNRE